MLRAGRSFTDPPGLNHSALAQNAVFGNSWPMRSICSKGVFPLGSSKDSPTRPARAPSRTFDSRGDAAMSFAVAMALNETHPHLLHRAGYTTITLRIACAGL